MRCDFCKDQINVPQFCRVTFVERVLYYILCGFCRNSLRTEYPKAFSNAWW